MPPSRIWGQVLAAYEHDYDPSHDPYDWSRYEVCPDPERLPRSYSISGSLWRGRFTEHGRLRSHEVKRFASRQQLGSLKRTATAMLREAGMRESDWFASGGGWMPGGQPQIFDQYIPLLPGPATRQLYWSDYFAMSAKCFECASHDPVAHRAVETTTEFVLGRGIEASFADDRAQEAWDRFWSENEMDGRLEEIDGDLSTFGEVMVRYFPLPAGRIAIRSIDPASIYEIVTDQEDIETVYFYHQQYQTPYELYAPPAANRAPTGPTQNTVAKYVIRQIPAQEIDHVKINVRSAEKRGRSDLFSALGYFKRLRDLMTSHVIRQDLLSRMVLDLKVEGTAQEAAALGRQMFPNGKQPPPGSYLAHNQQVDLSPFQWQSTSETGVEDVVQELINLIATGVGVPKQYLGIDSKGGRATALVATEPAAKRFERRQKVLERLLHKMADRVLDTAGITGEDQRKREFTFPGIVTEDRQAKIADLTTARANGVIADKTYRAAVANELGITTYDPDEEQDLIAEEWATAGRAGDGRIRRFVIAASNRQAAMLDPTKEPVDEDQPPGLLVPAGGTGSDPTDPASPTSRAGFPADENPASQAGAANIRKDNQMRERLVVLPESQLHAVIREAAREARKPRRRPDDPEFAKHAGEFRSATRDNLDQLVTGAA
jgi:hypothetical protein